ncbi:serine/threonine protein kinase [Phytophthora cinnamomi]|uniref:serine/threonine protein kinase n=1 Tax=Phytophthora cinnamomi TaxID=4785 RepID=UPI003559644F|nr:serine/threonine protein kinase [Phytophthora cinnamomi]
MFHERFPVHERLRSTMFGDIRLCHDRQDRSQLVAVKQVHLDLAKQAIDRNLTLDNPWNESRTLETLRVLGQHENVLQAREQVLQEDSWFLVMDFCDGGDLWQTLERLPNNRLPEPQTLQLFQQIVRGVRFLHDNGIAHRDLSLENVLLSRTGNNGLGTPKLCDFGVSTQADRVCNERVGKGYYMAPEVVVMAEYDPRAADMWSLGIVLFVLLTGKPLTPIALETENAFVAVRDLGVKAILNAWHMNDLASPATADLLDRLLQTNPAARLTVEDVLGHPAFQLP